MNNNASISSNLTCESETQKEKNNIGKNKTKSNTFYRTPILPSPSVFSFPTQQQQHLQQQRSGSIDDIKNDIILVLPVQYTSDCITTSRYSLPSNQILPLQHGVIVVPSKVTLFELMCRLQEQFDLPNEYNITLYTRERNKISSGKSLEKNQSQFQFEEQEQQEEIEQIEYPIDWNETPVAIQVIISILFFSNMPLIIYIYISYCIDFSSSTLNSFQNRFTN